VGEPGTDETLTAAVPTGRRLRVRSRVGRLHATHSFRLVLGLIAGSFLFSSLASDAIWTTAVLLVLQATILAAAIWTSGLARSDSRTLIGLLVVAGITAVALLVSGGTTLAGVAGLASGVMVVATIVAIAIGVVDQDEVNAQSITGAICIYLLLGMMFVFFYNATALLGAGDFFAHGGDGTRSLRLYFSFVTLATLGYGDYTPTGDVGRTLAVLEALIGQLYLVTVLALLVSRLRRGDDTRAG
jgi:hypothetical protein